MNFSRPHSNEIVIRLFKEKLVDVVIPRSKETLFLGNDQHLCLLRNMASKSTIWQLSIGQNNVRLGE